MSAWVGHWGDMNTSRLQAQTSNQRHFTHPSVLGMHIWLPSLLPESASRHCLELEIRWDCLDGIYYWIQLRLLWKLFRFGRWCQDLLNSQLLKTSLVASYLADYNCHPRIWSVLPLSVVSPFFHIGDWFQIIPGKLPRRFQTNNKGIRYD